jgi:hypothetical protein
MAISQNELKKQNLRGLILIFEISHVLNAHVECFPEHHKNHVLYLISVGS